MKTTELTPIQIDIDTTTEDSARRSLIDAAADCATKTLNTMPDSLITGCTHALLTSLFALDLALRLTEGDDDVAALRHETLRQVLHMAGIEFNCKMTPIEQQTMKHTQTATVREMRTLANTCQKHAADAAEHLKVCQRLSKATCDNAERADKAADRADQGAGRAFHAKNSTEDAVRRADRRAHEAQAAANAAQDAAKDAERFAKHAAATLLAIIIALLISILADAALHIFTH